MSKVSNIQNIRDILSIVPSKYHFNIYVRLEFWYVVISPQSLPGFMTEPPLRSVSQCSNNWIGAEQDWKTVWNRSGGPFWVSDGNTNWNGVLEWLTLLDPFLTGAGTSNPLVCDKTMSCNQICNRTPSWICDRNLNRGWDLEWKIEQLTLLDQ